MSSRIHSGWLVGVEQHLGKVEEGDAEQVRVRWLDWVDLEDVDER